MSTLCSCFCCGSIFLLIVFLLMLMFLVVALFSYEHPLFMFLSWLYLFVDHIVVAANVFYWRHISLRY